MMKNYKDIIEEGILEQYILGELHPSDEYHIDKLLSTNKDLKDHFDSLEADFERIGFENAVTPPSELKTLLLKQLKSPVSSESEIINLKQTSGYRFYFGLAASFAGLLLVSSIWLYSQLNKIQEDFKTVEADKQELNIQLDALNDNFQKSSELYALLSHPDTKQYILKGNKAMPDGKVISYVNHSMEAVAINTERLPELDDNHDYQMWADVEGEMINMGVIDRSQPLLAMNYIKNSESLNITIEPLGGSDHPTVERLVTNIYL